MAAGKGCGHNNMVRARFYDEHREEILADIKALGRREVLKKYGVPLSTWYNLARRWGMPEMRARQGDGQQNITFVPLPGGNGRRPQSAPKLARRQRMHISAWAAHAWPSCFVIWP